MAAGATDEFLAAFIRNAARRGASAAETAFEYLPRLTDPAERSRAEALTKTAALLTSEEERRVFFGKLVHAPGLPKDGPERVIGGIGRDASAEAALTLLEEHAAALSPAQFDRAAAAAASSRIDASTPAAADRLLKTLRGPERAEALSGFIQTWTRADFNAAAVWLKNLPPSADRDTAVAAFAAALEAVYRDWHAKAPEEADAYFQSKGLASP